MKQLITIGNLAKAAGVAKGTLRYYEAIGLIPKPQRSESGYRLYSETDVRRVQLIAQAGQLGMNLREIADLLNWASQETCQPFQQHFAELVARKIDELTRCAGFSVTLSPARSGRRVWGGLGVPVLSQSVAPPAPDSSSFQRRTQNDYLPRVSRKLAHEVN